jgi:protein-tyrosine phosphatase
MEHLQTGVAFIADEIARGGAVYVHCKSGVGRAATMAAAYFVTQGLPLEQAWMRIRQVRPFVRPTTVQVKQLEQFVAQCASTTGSTSGCRGI